MRTRGIVRALAVVPVVAALAMISGAATGIAAAQGGASTKTAKKAAKTKTAAAKTATTASTRRKHRVARKRKRAKAHQPAAVAEVASWYYDYGDTACGFHAHYGVANKTLPCGTRVRINYGGRTVEATVDDRGPYVYGRTYDLNQNVSRYLGMYGVATVHVAIL